MSGDTCEGQGDQGAGDHVNQGAPSLDWSDAVTISRVARYVGRLDKQIEWLETAVAYCHENCHSAVRELEKAVMEHDDVLLKHGLGYITDQTPDGLPEVPVFTFSHPLGEVKTSEVFEKSVTRFKKESKIVKMNGNIKELEIPTETKYLTKTFHRMWYYGQNTTIALCQGDHRVGGRETCSYLHYHNPYLALGPFKYEVLSRDPHVGIFRDFYSGQEVESILNRARGNIKSTGYQVSQPFLSQMFRLPFWENLKRGATGFGDWCCEIHQY